ncbi:unnamed protein product, partial [Rotaria sordida]
MPVRERQEDKPYDQPTSSNPDE